MKRAFVVGGAGFLGSHLVDRLLADGVEVDAIDDYSTGSLANLADARQLGASLKIHHLDAASPETRTLLGMKQPEVVYHLAALPVGRITSQRYADALSKTVALLESIREHRIAKVVVALPATSMYGWPDIRDLPLKEVPLVPRGVRGVMARSIVDLLQLHREQAAIEFTAVAMTTVFGPRQRPDGGVVANFRAAADAGRPAIITGDGRQTRDLLFIDDAVDALVRAGDRGSGLVINVGTGEQTSIRDLWEQMSSIPPEFTSAGPDHLGRFAVSPVRARIHLGWSPWTPLDDGLTSITARIGTG